MRLILLGAPGSGKGTQAQYIAERFGIPQISTGDMLRKSVSDHSALSLQIKSLMDAGSLIPDEIIIKLVQQRIQQPDCQKGFLLDGFPRTLKQAEALTLSGIPIDKVIELNVADEEIIKRLSGRRIHLASGRVYHMENQPPNRANRDDITGEALVQREDDKEATIRKRLKIYHDHSQLVCAYYMRLAAADPKRAPVYIKIDGAQPPLVVWDLIYQHLK